jgi:ribokinase
MSARHTPPTPESNVPTYDVIVCGSLHLDIVVRAPALPRIDETAVGSTWEQVCGGKGGNQAVQAAVAGAQTAMIGRIGRDDFGDKLKQNLVRAGVNHTYVTTDSKIGSGMSVAILQDNGDYGAVIVSGSNLAIEPARLAEHWQSMGGAKILVLQNEVPEAVNIAAATVAHEHRAIVVLNAAPARILPKALQDLIDVLVVNRVEAEAMSGMQVTDRMSARLAVPALSQNQKSVVITLGGDGMVVRSTNGEITDIAAVPVTVTSTHGAGDCFVGVLAASLANGKTLVDACQLANQHAAAFVSRT